MNSQVMLKSRYNIKAAILIGSPKKDAPTWGQFAIYCNFLKIIFVLTWLWKTPLEAACSVVILKFFNTKEAVWKN